MKTRRCVYCKRRRPLKAVQMVYDHGGVMTRPWCRNTKTCGFAYWAEAARNMRRSLGVAERIWEGLAMPERSEGRRAIESINESRIRKEAM